MSSGRIVQIIGAVIDVEFPRESVPEVYDALLVSEKGLTLEVQQQLVDIHRHHFGAEKRDIRKEVAVVKPQAGQTSMALAAHLVAQLTSVSQLFERAEQIASVEKTLEEMNELDREVIALRHFEELSNIETAEVLGIQPAAASKRYLRALKRLREIMEQVKGMS